MKLRIGIIQTDSVVADLVPDHGDYPDMFRRLLGDPGARPLDWPVPEFVDIDVLGIVARGEPWPAAAACDGYVITGSRHSVYDPLPWIPPLVDFVGAVLAAGKRVIGVCFGHQLLAHHFGGEARRAETGWCVGVHAAEVRGVEAWMQPSAAGLRLISSHQDQVVRLPPGARQFAAGALCPQAGFVWGNAMTLQGHPEFSRPYAEALLTRRETLLGPDLCARARASLDGGTDARLAARWMLQFIATGHTVAHHATAAERCA